VSNLAAERLTVVVARHAKGSRKHKHYWDRTGSPLNLDRVQICHRDYGVGVQANQFLRQCPELLGNFGRKAMFQHSQDRGVLSLERSNTRLLLRHCPRAIARQL
jgi:hypothetical protein